MNDLEEKLQVILRKYDCAHNRITKENKYYPSICEDNWNIYVNRYNSFKMKDGNTGAGVNPFSLFLIDKKIDKSIYGSLTSSSYEPYMYRHYPYIQLEKIWSLKQSCLSSAFYASLKGVHRTNPFDSLTGKEEWHLFNLGRFIMHKYYGAIWEYKKYDWMDI